MPGPTDTDFFRRADMLDTKVGQQSKDDPAQVAAQGFKALMAGERKGIAGSVSNKAQGGADKGVPDRLKAAAHRRGEGAKAGGRGDPKGAPPPR